METQTFNRSSGRELLCERIGSRANWIDQIRLGAAIMVVFGHSWHLALGPQAQVPFEDYTVLGLHELAVHVFFFLSGLLVTESAKRHATRPVSYVSKRVRRIMPALVANAALVPIILLLVGAWSANLNDLAVYAVRLISLFFVQYDHPGAFAGNPFAGAINGSVWSLRHEIVVYALLMVAALTGALSFALPRALFISFVAALIIAGHWAAGQEPTGALFMLAEGRYVLFSFIVGVACHQFSGRIVLDTRITFPGIALLLLAFMTDAPIWLVELGVVTLVCGVTLLLAFARKEARGLSDDLSYGIYIYSWPIQQWVVFAWISHWEHSPHPLTVFLASMVPLCMVAWLSWRLIEKPMLTWQPEKRLSDWLNQRRSAAVR